MTLNVKGVLVMAKGFNITDLQDASKWKMTEKKLYEVYTCRPVLGTAVTNKLEGASYTTDKNRQFVMSGTLGEQWVIDIKKLVSTYVLADGREITADVLNSKKANKAGEIDWMRLKTRRNGQKNWAIMLPASVKNYPVQTSRGDTLIANRAGVAHGLGDFLVCSDAGGRPNFNDMQVVNGIVFPTTYDMRPFPGIMKEISLRMKGKNLTETVVPKSIIGKKTSTEAKVEEATPATRGAKRTEYQLTGRYIDEKTKSIVGYHLQSIESGKEGKYSRNQFCYLVGRGQVTNCTGSVSGGRVIIRGKGINIDELPIVAVKRDEIKGSVASGAGARKGAPETSDVSKFRLVGKIKAGNSFIGFVISNAGNGEKKINKDQLIALIQQGRVSNVKYQNYQGRQLLRGVGCSLNELPVYTV